MTNMQPTYGPVSNDTDLTTGGGSDLVNGQECEAIRASYENMAARAGDLSNEDDSHVQGVYRESDFAGS